MSNKSQVLYEFFIILDDKSFVKEILQIITYASILHICVSTFISTKKSAQHKHTTKSPRLLAQSN